MNEQDIPAEMIALRDEAIGEADADLRRLLEYAISQVADHDPKVVTDSLVSGLLTDPRWGRLELASVVGTAVVRLAQNPLIAARERAQAAREAFSSAAQTADQITNERGVKDCGCPNGDKRACGWRAGANAVAQAMYEAARTPFNEQARP